MSAKAPERRPKDANQLAKSVVDEATCGAAAAPAKKKDAAAVSLGRRGGLKGGKARAEALSAGERSQIAAKAARARWGRTSDDT